MAKKHDGLGGQDRRGSRVAAYIRVSAVMGRGDDRLALRCGDKWQSEAILGQGNDDAARIPVSSPGWGLLTTDHGPRGIQVYDLTPDRIQDFTCAALRVSP